MFDVIKLRNERQGLREVNNLPTQPLIPRGDANVEIDVPSSNSQLNSAVLVLLLYIIPITLIVYGAIHLHDCPAENMIDISMIVLGGLALASRLLNCPYDLRSIFGIRDEAPKNTCLICLNFILQLGLIGVFIAMSYWILIINPDTKPEDHDSPNYCELRFYRNTWWSCVIGGRLWGLYLSVVLCFAAAYA